MIAMFPSQSLRRPLAVLIGVLTAMLAAAAAAPAAAHGPDPILSGGLYTQNEVLDYRWAGSPTSTMKSAIKDGVADANATRKSKAPSFAYSSGGASTIYYGVNVPCGVNGLACMRRYPPDTFGVWFRENGHRFDWGTLRWCELSGSPDGCYQVENVTLDELGHVMVLDHHDNYTDDGDYGDAVVQTYSRTKPRTGWNAHAFGRCDVATLQQQYDVASASTLYSTCLDVPTTLSLSASRTSVAVGATVTFTATLRSNGTGRLSNNLISSRTVVLQQRTASGWADVSTMTAGSGAGTYTIAVTMRVDTDFRALFRKPSNEGLRASASPAITVYVTCVTSPCAMSAPGGAQ